MWLAFSIFEQQKLQRSIYHLALKAATIKTRKSSEPAQHLRRITTTRISTLQSDVVIYPCLDRTLQHQQLTSMGGKRYALVCIAELCRDGCASSRYRQSQRSLASPVKMSRIDMRGYRRARDDFKFRLSIPPSGSTTHQTVCEYRAREK